MCIVCAACISEHVTLHAGDLPYEIEWDGSVISLNITSQSKRAVDAHLWQRGKIETYRGSVILLEGNYKWLDLTSLRADNNTVHITWEIVPPKQSGINSYFCFAILFFKLLAIFQVRYAEKIFMLVAVAFALWQFDPETFVQRLILTWSVK